MKYIVITTPRTGSTMITSMIADLARQWWDSKGYLGEYFTMTHLYSQQWEMVNERITCTSYVRHQPHNYPQPPTLEEKNQERNRRLHLLQSDNNYVFKIFSLDMTSEIQDYVKQNYNIIYLERQNKLDQLLSFLGIVSSGVAHWADSSKKLNKIHYDKSVFAYLSKALNHYYYLKTVMPGQTVIYEDFLNRGANQQSLIEILDLPRMDFVPLNWHYVPTPYDQQPQNMIANHEQWQLDLPDIIAQFDKYNI